LCLVSGCGALAILEYLIGPWWVRLNKTIDFDCFTARRVPNKAASYWQRFGLFLFIFFLRENGYLLDSKEKVKLNENALVALALLMAESEPQNKDLMIRLTMNILTEDFN